MRTHYQPPRYVLPAAKAEAIVIAIHGMTSDARELQPLADYLALRRCVVVLPTLLGHEDVLLPNAATKLKYIEMETWLNQCRWELQAIASRESLPIFIVGSSFGGLMTMQLALDCASLIRGVCLLAVPFQFRGENTERGLKVLCRLPEPILNCLGTVPKNSEYTFWKYPRFRMNSYSLAAAARLVRQRKRLLATPWSVAMPTYYIQAPDDSLVDEASIAIAAEHFVGPNLTMSEVPGGGHELTIGAHCEKVWELIADWVQLSLTTGVR